jgi:hypothetical protein
LDLYIFSRLNPWPQVGGGLARFKSFQGYILPIQIHPFKRKIPIFFKY